MRFLPIASIEIQTSGTDDRREYQISTAINGNGFIGRAPLKRKKRFDLTAAMYNAQDKNIVAFDTVNNHVVTYGKAAGANTKIFIP